MQKIYEKTPQSLFASNKNLGSHCLLNEYLLDEMKNENICEEKT
jgi:hypothetical protein